MRIVPKRASYTKGITKAIHRLRYQTAVSTTPPPDGGPGAADLTGELLETEVAGSHKSIARKLSKWP